MANGILPKYFYTIGHMKDGLVQLMHTYVFTKVGKWHVTCIVYSHFPLWLMRKSMEEIKSEKECEVSFQD